MATKITKNMGCYFVSGKNRLPMAYASQRFCPVECNFKKWKEDGTFEEILDQLNEMQRKKMNRNALPT